VRDFRGSHNAMLSKVWSAATLGIDAVRIVIEVDSGGYSAQPGFSLVGLPDAAVREAYRRVRAALANSGFFLPQRNITVNLSPADIKKEGSGFDLPIAIGILHASEFLRDEHVAGRVFVGELSLDGSVSPVRGALSISAALAGDDSFRELVVPQVNANEAAAVHSVRVVGAPTLATLLAHLRGEASLEPATSIAVRETTNEPADFAEVRGQAQAKRALEVAAAGGHNVMMIGPPGSGKTMLARRLPTILAPLDHADALEVTKIHSAAGSHRAPALRIDPPFRQPHHSETMDALWWG